MADQPVESEGFYEMLWDCSHCGTKGLLGKTHRCCAECGAPQDADKRYFPTEEQKKLAVGHVYVGADAHCPSCGAAMGAKAKACTQCGSPMDGSKPVVGAADPLPVATGTAKAARSGWPAWAWLLIAAAVLAIIGFVVWWMFFRTKPGQVTIESHRWSTSIAIEEYGDHEHTAWRSDVPSMASNLSCHQEQHGSHQVSDGEDCHSERHDKKDGTYEQVRVCSPKTRSVPDYDDRCTYFTKEWAKVDEVSSSGIGTAVEFPTAVVSGQRRAGARTETLHLDFVGGKSCDWSASPGDRKETAWRGLSDGAVLAVELRARSGDVVCSSAIP